MKVPAAQVALATRGRADMALQAPFIGSIEELHARLSALIASGHGQARIGVAFLDGLPVPEPVVAPPPSPATALAGLLGHGTG